MGRYPFDIIDVDAVLFRYRISNKVRMMFSFHLNTSYVMSFCSTFSAHPLIVRLASTGGPSNTILSPLIRTLPSLRLCIWCVSYCLLPSLLVKKFHIGYILTKWSQYSLHNHAHYRMIIPKFFSSMNTLGSMLPTPLSAHMYICIRKNDPATCRGPHLRHMVHACINLITPVSHDAMRPPCKTFQATAS